MDEILSIEQLLKTLFALISVCSLAAVLVIFVLPKLKLKRKSPCEDFSLEVVKRIPIDRSNSFVVCKDRSGEHFVFSVSGSGMRFQGSLQKDGSFIPGNDSDLVTRETNLLKRRLSQ